MGKVIYVKFGGRLVVNKRHEAPTAATHHEGFDMDMLTSASVYDRPMDKNWCALDAAVQRLLDDLRSNQSPRFRRSSTQVTPENK
ncbi:MAG: hypothetical protein COB78_10000 [Hyphomicrobiales bacterium]|nr:MAG: hypothetical protein COB78_10000 [Hyphomicrobiales bacterium]